MKFKSLAVGSGDAFLLETGNNNTILFDSGGSKSKITEVLKKENIKTINLAICSHNDQDHANGFIGLLKNPRFTINEIWLPGIWVPILNFLIENRQDEKLLDILKEYEKDIQQIRENDNNINQYYACLEETELDIEEFNEKLELLSEINNNLYIPLSYYTLPNEPLIKLDRIKEIAELAYQKGCVIRWFIYDKNTTSIIPPTHNFNPLNSKEVTKIPKVSKSNFNKTLALSLENEHSLMFEYYKNEKPIVLFFADSDTTYLSNNVALPLKYKKNEIIITAPHHGSKDNVAAYSNVTGQNIIWVRSGAPGGNVCSEFKSEHKKYCLKYNKGVKDEIIFELKNKTWTRLKGRLCPNNCGC